MIKAQELRIGNYHEYFIEDNVDERQEYWAVGQIDWQDIKILSDREQRFKNHPPPNPPKEYYRAIPLSEEWLLKCGFEYYSSENMKHNLIAKMEAYKHPMRSGFGITLSGFHSLPHIKCVHHLQNLTHSLTGEELTVKHEG